MSAPGELAVESTCQALPLTRRLDFRQDRKDSNAAGDAGTTVMTSDLLTDRSFTPPRLGRVWEDAAGVKKDAASLKSRLPLNV